MTIGFALPTRFRLLTTPMGLVTLALISDGPIHPLSPKYSGSMAFIHAPTRDAHDDDRFQGDIMFIEVLVRRMTTPRL